MPIRLKQLFRRTYELAAWRPANLRLISAQLIDLRRNARLECSDADHLRAAADWLGRAQDAGSDGGIAGRYFLRRGWSSSYPETTGYLIPTLLRLAEEPGLAALQDRAERAVRFLLSIQLPGGGFPGEEIANNRTEPSIFNTGQILHGLHQWYRATGDGKVLDAARRAADWLSAEQHPDGVWHRYVYLDLQYTYMAYAAGWLAEFGVRENHAAATTAARRHLLWVLRQQDRATGWFERCGFTAQDHRDRVAMTHTIAYTIAGVLHASRLLAQDDGIAAARLAARGVARRLELSRRLPGILDASWKSRAGFSCLTGNAQMALIWLELHGMTAEPPLLSAACKAIDEVKRAQPLFNPHPGIRGGIPGSFPIWGDYIPYALPNWAAKYFIDALLAKRAALEAFRVPPSAPAELDARLPRGLPVAPQPATPVPRVVLYASPRSGRAEVMLRRWESWGFRPDAVVLTSEPVASPGRRVMQKLREDGVGGVSRRLLRRAARPSPGAGSSDPAASLETLCRNAGIPLVRIGRLADAASVAAVRALQPDLAVYAASEILRRSLLELPRLGTLNAHMGLLPRYRGMNVAEWARVQGDVVGCTVHLIDEGIDTGGILLCRAIEVAHCRGIAELRAAVDAAQLDLLGEVVRYVIMAGALPPARPQQADEGRQYFAMHPALRDLLERGLSGS